MNPKQLDSNHWKFWLTKTGEAPTKDNPILERVDVESIVVRELRGRDERTARVNAEARGKDSTIIQELVRMSIVVVDDVPVEVGVGCAAYVDDWSTRTRAFAFAAYTQINGADGDELAAFLKGGKPLAATPPSTSSTASSGGGG